MPMSSQEDCHQQKREHNQSINEANELQLNTKRQKRSSDNYSPHICHVWDNLSKITLTRKALKEFNHQTQQSKPTQTARIQETAASQLLKSDTL